MESAFGDCLDVVLTGVIDRDTEKRVKKSGQFTKTENIVTDQVRKLYFRGTTLIDAGGRFAADAVPEYMVFDQPNMADEFIRVVEEGIEKSRTNSTKSKEPTFKPEQVEIKYDTDEDANPSAQTQAADDLKELKVQIITVATQKGGSKDESVVGIVKKYAPNGNPNSIKTIESAKQLLAELQTLNDK